MSMFSKIVIPLGMLALICAPVQAAIYKTYDADGNVIFTDAPPEGVAAEEIEINTINTIPAPKQPTQNGDSATEEEQLTNEITLAITQPLADEAVRSNNGNITIALKAEPALAEGNVLVITLDEAEVARGTQTTVSLNNIPRGTHTVTAHIESANGTVIARAPAVQFHILRASAVSLLSF